MSNYEKKETPPKGMEISNRAAGEQDDMSKRKYIRWDAEGVEKVPPNEAENIQAVADMINACQKAQWDSHRHCFSGSCTSQVMDNPRLIFLRDPRSYTRFSQGEVGGAGRLTQTPEAESVRTWRRISSGRSL